VVNMSFIMRIFLCSIFLIPGATWGQKVGLVLSGGGATGMAHIGVLKALEEQGIQIDYVTGTSAGALIGGLYSAGYSPLEIERLASEEQFQLMVQGLIEAQYKYYYKERPQNPGWLTFKLNKDSLLATSLPTNLIKPILIDYNLMTLFSGASALGNNNFDSIFVPFRCVASDINAQESVIFNKGFLNEAIRASMTYPFYLKPISIDGKIMFDGGLYNNFPVDVMDKTFNPDFIIGSNVSGNANPASDDNLLSQIKNLILSPSNFSIPDHKGVMITPQVDEIGTFDFDRIKKAIDQGYKATLLMIDSIRLKGIPQALPEKVKHKRQIFRDRIPPLRFYGVQINGLNRKQQKYAERILFHKDSIIDLKLLKKHYFRFALDDKISFTFPKAKYNPQKSAYLLLVETKKEKDFVLDIGGNFSSRPINTGFLGLEYNYLGLTSTKLRANSYFGKYYGAAQVAIRIDFPSRIPFYAEPYYALNRWDYFRSFATFFEESRPSFIVNREQFGGLKFGIATGNRSKLDFNILYADLDYRYYQVEDFQNTDTADITNFYPLSAKISYQRSTLNRKQYANSGTYFRLTSNIVSGNELTLPGSTLNDRDTIVDNHKWVFSRIQYKKYFEKIGRFTLGLNLEGVFSTQKFFENYTASLLGSPSYEPIPEMKTLFLPQFRAYQYLAGGLELITKFTNYLELRIGGNYFQPVWEIEKTATQTATIGDYFKVGPYALSSTLVFQSPVGPVSLNLNYYDRKEDPFIFSLNFGYIIHNPKAIR